MTDTVTYQLKRPVVTTFKGPQGDREETITEVTLRRATVKDLRLMDQYNGQPVAMTIAMIVALSGLSPMQVDKIDADDFGPLGNLAVPGSMSGRETGETA